MPQVISLREFQNKIQESIDNSSLEEARAYTDHLLATYPKNAKGLHFSGEILYRQNNPEPAEQALLKLLAIEPQNGDAHLYLGRIYDDRNNTRRALAHYKYAVEGDADAKEFALTSRILQLHHSIHSEVITRVPMSVGSAARQYLQSGQPEPAVQVLENAVRKNPNMITLQVMLVYALWQTGRQQRAVELGQDIHAEHPDIADINELLASFWIKQQRKSDAKHYLIRLTGTHPYRALALLRPRGTIYDEDITIAPLDYEPLSQQLTSTSGLEYLEMVPEVDEHASATDFLDNEDDYSWLVTEGEVRTGITGLLTNLLDESEEDQVETPLPSYLDSRSEDQRRMDQLTGLAPDEFVDSEAYTGVDVSEYYMNEMGMTDDLLDAQDAEPDDAYLTDYGVATDSTDRTSDDSDRVVASNTQAARGDGTSDLPDWLYEDETGSQAAMTDSATLRDDFDEDDATGFGTDYSADFSQYDDDDADDEGLYAIAETGGFDSDTGVAGDTGPSATAGNGDLIDDTSELIGERSSGEFMDWATEIGAEIEENPDMTNPLSRAYAEDVQRTDVGSSAAPDDWMKRAGVTGSDDLSDHDEDGFFDANAGFEETASYDERAAKVNSEELSWLMTGDSTMLEDDRATNETAWPVSTGTDSGELWGGMDEENGDTRSMWNGDDDIDDATEIMFDAAVQPTAIFDDLEEETSDPNPWEVSPMVDNDLLDTSELTDDFMDTIDTIRLDDDVMESDFAVQEGEAFSMETSEPPDPFQSVDFDVIEFDGADSDWLSGGDSGVLQGETHSENEPDDSFDRTAADGVSAGATAATPSSADSGRSNGYVIIYNEGMVDESRDFVSDPNQLAFLLESSGNWIVEDMTTHQEVNVYELLGASVPEDASADFDLAASDYENFEDYDTAQVDIIDDDGMIDALEQDPAGFITQREGFDQIDDRDNDGVDDLSEALERTFAADNRRIEPVSAEYLQDPNQVPEDNTFADFGGDFEVDFDAYVNADPYELIDQQNMLPPATEAATADQTEAVFGASDTSAGSGYDDTTSDWNSDMGEWDDETGEPMTDDIISEIFGDDAQATDDDRLAPVTGQQNYQTAYSLGGEYGGMDNDNDDADSDFGSFDMEPGSIDDDRLAPPESTTRSMDTAISLGGLDYDLDEDTLSPLPPMPEGSDQTMLSLGGEVYNDAEDLSVFASDWDAELDTDFDDNIFNTDELSVFNLDTAAPDGDEINDMVAAQSSGADDDDSTNADILAEFDSFDGEDDDLLTEQDIWGSRLEELAPTVRMSDDSDDSDDTGYTKDDGTSMPGRTMDTDYDLADSGDLVSDINTSMFMLDNESSADLLSDMDFDAFDSDADFDGGMDFDMGADAEFDAAAAEFDAMDDRLRSDNAGYELPQVSDESDQYASAIDNFDRGFDLEGDAGFENSTAFEDSFAAGDDTDEKRTSDFSPIYDNRAAIIDNSMFEDVSLDSADFDEERFRRDRFGSSLEETDALTGGLNMADTGIDDMDIDDMDDDAQDVFGDSFDSMETMETEALETGLIEADLLETEDLPVDHFLYEEFSSINNTVEPVLSDSDAGSIDYNSSDFFSDDDISLDDLMTDDVSNSRLETWQDNSFNETYDNVLSEDTSQYNTALDDAVEQENEERQSYIMNRDGMIVRAGDQINFMEEPLAEEEEIQGMFESEDIPPWLQPDMMLAEDEIDAFAEDGEPNDDDRLLAQAESDTQASAPVTGDDDADDVPDWINALVPGVDQIDRAAHEAGYRGELDEQRNRRVVDTEKFAWLTDLVEQETPASRTGNERVRYDFSRLPVWLRDIRPGNGSHQHDVPDTLLKYDDSL